MHGGEGEERNQAKQLKPELANFFFEKMITFHFLSGLFLLSTQQP
jgi:hypothetical protein